MKSNISLFISILAGGILIWSFQLGLHPQRDRALVKEINQPPLQAAFSVASVANNSAYIRLLLADTPVDLDALKSGTDRNYEFPESLIYGEEARIKYEEVNKQFLTDASPKMIEEIKTIMAEKVSIFDAVRAEVLRYQEQDRALPTHFSLGIESIVHDLDRCRTLVQYGFGYTNKQTAKQVIISLGKPHASEWERAMRSYGVIYQNAGYTWPRISVTNLADIPKGLRQIARGDWRGAYEDVSGRIYVPGLLCLAIATSNRITGGGVTSDHADADGDGAGTGLATRHDGNYPGQPAYIQELEEKLELDYDNALLHARVANAYMREIEKGSIQNNELGLALMEYSIALSLTNAPSLRLEFRNAYELYGERHIGLGFEEFCTHLEAVKEATKEWLRKVRDLQVDIRRANAVHSPASDERVLAGRAAESYAHLLYLIVTGRQIIRSVEGTQVILAKGFYEKADKGLRSYGFELKGHEVKIGTMYSQNLPQDALQIKFGHDKGYYERPDGTIIVPGIRQLDALDSQK